MVSPKSDKPHYRSVWVSDVHLGTRGCKAAYLDDFLAAIECDNLYLVGDIIDGWAMSRGTIYFPQEHVNILRRFLNKARKGSRVTYVIGNHDEFLRKYIEDLAALGFGNIRIVNECVHRTADNKTLWITHGDLYDVVIRYHRWLAYLGDRGYDFLLWLNRHFNWLRAKFGVPYWSLSAYVKNRVKQALEFINSFEETLARECASRGYNGVVCGHIHKAVMKTVGGVLYCNDGDWVESCTALVEHDDGRLEIIQWHIVSHDGAAKAATAAAAVDATT